MQNNIPGMDSKENYRKVQLDDLNLRIPLKSYVINSIVRYVKSRKKRININCPAVAKAYNKHMEAST